MVVKIAAVADDGGPVGDREGGALTATESGPGVWALMLGVLGAALTVPDDWPWAGRLVVSLVVTVVVREGAGAVGPFVSARRHQARQRRDR